MRTDARVRQRERSWPERTAWRVVAWIRHVEDQVFADEVAVLGSEIFPHLVQVETHWTLRGRDRRLTLWMRSEVLDESLSLSLPGWQRDESALAEWAWELRSLRRAGPVRFAPSPERIARQQARDRERLG
jgi:hypothetical protein